LEKKLKCYVASSWRCLLQPAVVSMLRNAGVDVYDFKNPAPGEDDFRWTEIDGGWQAWDREAYRKALKHPVAEKGFKNDFDAMKWADFCVLVLPCGRSAHLEAGYFVGAGKPLVILILDDEQEPELMYKMASHVCTSVNELFDAVEALGGTRCDELHPAKLGDRAGPQTPGGPTDGRAGVRHGAQAGR
jgi:hypothetical protein